MQSARKAATGDTDARCAAGEGARSGDAPPLQLGARRGGSLAREARLYLAAVDAFRGEGCRLTWAAEQLSM